MGQGPRVIVIGAGILGAAVAWHLARGGARVTVIGADAGGPASAASFGWINASRGNAPGYALFRLAAMEEWRRLTTDCPDLPVAFDGALDWDAPRPELHAFAAERAAQGHPLRGLSRAEVAAREPNLRAPPDFALAADLEGAAEPAAVAQALLARAVDLGAVVLRSAVTALAVTGAGVTGVQANRPLSADHVVLAAGVATPAIAATAGLQVPMQVAPGLLVWTAPGAAGMLVGILIAPGLHMRVTRDGRLLAGGSFGVSDPTAQPEATAARIHAAMQALLRPPIPAFSQYRIGQRPLPADGHPILGLTDVAGLSLALSHSGVTLAPLVGRLVAAEVLTGVPEPMLADWRLSRFAGR